VFKNRCRLDSLWSVAVTRHGCYNRRLWT